MKKVAVVILLAGALVLDGAALGRTEAPTLPLGPQPQAFVAPANAAATQRTLDLPFAPQAAPGQVIKSWTFSVYDASGRLVWSKTETQTKDRGFFGELFNLGPRPAAEVPAQLTWDGTYGLPGSADDGKPVPNGPYTYLVSVTDSTGQTTQSPPHTVSVQNSPVRVTTLAVDHAVFSPRGQRNTVTIVQDGTREARWEGTFRDASGQAVRTFLWTNPTDLVSADPSPAPFSWDGRDDGGQVLPDGEYQYTLVGTNRAGATASAILGTPVVISSKPGVLRITADRAVFSPAADQGWSRTLALRPDVGNADGLVDWTVTVADAGHPKVALWTRSGKAPLPDTLVFDGKDQVGRPLPDGAYLAALASGFTNGDTAVSPPLSFEIDTTAPRGTLKSAEPVFGGTGRPVTRVDFLGDGNLSWTLDVAGPDGKVVGTFPLGDLGQASVEVPGPGMALVDGTYTLRATAHDRAGNLGRAELTLTRDTRPMTVALEPSSPVLVPGNSANGTVTVRPVLEVTDSVVQALWTLSVPDAQGNEGTVLDRQSGPAALPYQWTGSVQGKPLADGAYRVALAVTYANGTTARAQKDLKIDSRYLREPQGTLTPGAAVFGGPGRPSVTVAFQGDPGIPWTLEVVDKAGKAAASYPLGTTGTASVDVPGASGPALADGTYTLRASAVTKAGVPGAVTAPVTKDSRVRKVTLDLSRTVLVPDKGTNGQVRITPVPELLDGLVSTELTVSAPGGTVVARLAKDGPVTFWDWDGKDLAGATPPNGTYQAAAALTYANGATARATAELKIDSSYLTEPQGTLLASAPVFGGASRPTVSVAFTGDPGVVWALDVTDRTGKTLRTVSLGDSGRATVEVGQDAGGKPLADGTYTLRASAKSKAGLTGVATAEVQKDSRPRTAALDLSTPVLVPGNTLNGSVKVTPVLAILDGVVSTTLGLTGPDGRTVTSKTWEGLVPFWDWDGKDELGKPQADGTYQVTLGVSWANGDSVQVRKPLQIDSTYLKEPQGTLTASAPVFGGPGRAGVTVAFQGDPGIPWTLDILGQDGKPVRQESLGDSGSAKVDFQGLDSQNQPLPDGPYTLRASAVSRAGVPGTALLQLRKDSRQAKAGIDLSRTVLVPGKGANGTVRITPLLDYVDSVSRTVLSILGPGGKVVAERSADGTLPFWDWSGTDAQGGKLANGPYQVALTVRYDNGSEARAQAEVKVDSTYLNDQGPLVEMALSSKTFAPNNVDGATDLTVTIKATEGVVPVDGWNLTVLDPRGKAFRQWSGKGLPPKSVYWDGKGDAGDTVDSGEDYQIQLKVSDTQGHITRKQDTVTIDISVVKLAEGKYKIVVSSIQFAGNSDDVFKVQPDLLTKNLFVLRRLANALGKFPGYKIRLEGYAVSEYWNDPKTAEWEQKTQLLPLSLGRAQAVRNVMVLLGIDPDRFTVQGFGGDRPLVPHSDLENRWKNRRVEFYLDKS